MSENPLRVVIADDEESVRNMLACYMCSFFKGVEVVGLAADGGEFLEVVRRTLPDTVFVDVQMPGLDGLSAAQLLQREYPKLFVVFISAHTQYAVEAFNLDATDFLTKPISIERLGKALAKIRRSKDLMASDNIDDHNLLDNSGKLVLKSGHGLMFLDKKTILFIEKQGLKCIIHTTNGIYENGCSLCLIEKNLWEPCFFRCQKSFIINVLHVERIEPYADRAYKIFFKNYPHTASMRREKFEDFCKRINL